jgi:cellulose synthase/poly-beta-1,6-N-acetylglucosamine synthase-like glycosyltransferase
MLVLEILLSAAAIPALVWASYLFVLVVCSGRAKVAPPGPPTKRFDIVVPAHNEEGQIAATVASLLATDYPADMRRVWVVADNCTDATADRANAAGATALVRTNAEKRGKGYALEFAYEKLLSEPYADAIVVVDADTSVSKNLLSAFGARFEKGARAVQAEYGVRNPKASWRTRLITIALAIFHELRSLARERMGLSCGLRGNGMGFSREILETVPHDAYSIVEDIEYGIRLGRAGHRVWYVAEASVLGDMVATEKESRSQRERWEGGRLQLAKTHLGGLFRDAIAQRSGMLFDLAMDLAVPALTIVVVWTVVGAVVATALAVVTKSPGLVAPWAFSAFVLLLYVGRGVVLSGSGFRGVLDLAAAPAYIAWKLALSLRRSSRKKGEWVRTARESEKAP